MWHSPVTLLEEALGCPTARMSWLPRNDNLDTGALELLGIARRQHRIVGSTDGSNLCVESTDPKAETIPGVDDRGVVDAGSSVEEEHLVAERVEHVLCRAAQKFPLLRLPLASRSML